MARTLITDAFVLTMDDDLGTLPRADVLIDGARIAAVGPDLPREADVELVDGRDRIVMPGFVDTHRHMWAAMLRGCACYGDLGTYFHDVVLAAQPRNVEHVWIEGLPRKRDGDLTGIDAARLTADATAAAAGLSERLGRPLT